MFLAHLAFTRLVSYTKFWCESGAHTKSSYLNLAHAKTYTTMVNSFSLKHPLREGVLILPLLLSLLGPFCNSNPLSQQLWHSCCVPCAAGNGQQTTANECILIYINNCYIYIYICIYHKYYITYIYMYIHIMLYV